MKPNFFLASIYGLFLFSSCLKNNLSVNQTINDRAQPLAKGSVLFSKDEESYLYDLILSEHFGIFLDNQSDTVLWIFKTKAFKEPVATIRRSFGQNGFGKPLVCKEVSASSNKTDEILLVDNNLYYKKLTLNTKDNSASISTLYSNKKNINHSTDFNRATNDIYAIPIHRSNKNPFYIFNPDSGYYWVDPDPQIETILPQDVLSYTNTICLNEEQNSVVSAYRFTNYISFYELDGRLRQTVQFGKDPIIPTIHAKQNEINIEKTPKCFIHIYGTPQYVYCLYDGSTDFTSPSKIAIFQWNGKHVATWQADRNLRAIAVDKEDKYILAISSNKNGQDIIKYNFKQ